MSFRALTSRSHTFRISLAPSSRRLVPPQNAIRRVSMERPSVAADSRPKQRRGVRVTTVFGVLLAFGIGSTAYGLYDFYNALALWPDEIRSDLRAGLKARNQDNLGLSERYLRRAYQTALALPASTFAPSPFLKLSGIAITLASVLEADGRPKEARDVYVQALALSTNSNSTAGNPWQEEGALTPEEVLRQVSLTYKLGEMAERYNFGEEEEEKWLTRSVERLLEVIKEPTFISGLNGGAEGKEGVILADLDLPKWVTKTNLGAPLEALGAFYARQGKVEYAMPLYVQAIHLLMPNSSPTQSLPVDDKCRAAQIMNNISSLIMSKTPTQATLTQAESWARTSMTLCDQEISTAKKRDKDQLSVCETTLAVAMFNLASMREMADDRATAREYFTKSLDQSKSIGMREGIMEAQAALRRLDKADRRVTKAPP